MTYVWKCKICGSEIESRRKLIKHHRDEHPGERYVWNRGLTKADDERIKIQAEQVRQIMTGKKYVITDEIRELRRKIALEGYRSGRWHGWMNCHSSKKSYPEEFFTRVIENEFLDKEFEYNYLFFQYRLDFAWVKKKRCIEIDGSQHQRCKAQIESDKRKDRKLKEEGWSVLRIPWKCLYENTKEYIDKARKFIEA